MLEEPTRWSVIRAAFWRPGVGLVNGAWAVYGVLEFADAKVIPRLPDNLRGIWSAIYILPSLSWRTWLMILMAIVAGVSIDGAYRLARSYAKRANAVLSGTYVREKLAELYEEGRGLTLAVHRNHSDSIDPYFDWSNRVTTFLRDYLDNSYVVRFKTANLDGVNVLLEFIKERK